MNTIPEDLSGAMSSVASTRMLLVAVDFDGTLAPLIDEPELSRMLPAAEDALLRLAGTPATRVAIVSGRALEVLERLTGAPDSVALVGSHGSEFRVDGVTSGPTLGEGERRTLAELDRIISSVADQFEGALFEHKPAGAGLHTRRASRADAAEAVSLALRQVAELEGRMSEGRMTEGRMLGGRTVEDSSVEDRTVAGNRVAGNTVAGNTEQPGHGSFIIRRGKDILEFSLGEADKGTAMLRLRRELGATGVLFIGDDVTDEDGFAVLGQGDVGVKVGAGDSAAEYRVENPEAVAQLLELLVDARSAGLSVSDQSGRPRESSQNQASD